jgi:hypothetical protein
MRYLAALIFLSGSAHAEMRQAAIFAEILPAVGIQAEPGVTGGATVRVLSSADTFMWVNGRQPYGSHPVNHVGRAERRPGQVSIRPVFIIDLP